MPAISSMPLADLPPPYITKPPPVYTRTEPSAPSVPFTLSPPLYGNPYDLEANRLLQLPRAPISRIHVPAITRPVTRYADTLPEAVAPLALRRPWKAKGWSDGWIVIIIVVIVLSVIIFSVVMRELNPNKGKIITTTTSTPTISGFGTGCTRLIFC
jgi:hypothetical protein